MNSDLTSSMPEGAASAGEASAPEAPDAGKRVSWVELFFDLVFVVAVTQVSDLLRADQSWAGAGRALVVFVPVYWAWVGTTMHANLHDVDRAAARVGVFAVGLCGLFMALAVPGAYGARGVLFGASYWVARLVLYPLVLRTYRGTGFSPFTAGAFVTGPLLLAGGLLQGWSRIALWSVAAGVDLIVPSLALRSLTRVPFEPGHLSERYGLFVIIALGESVAATGVTAAGQPLTAARLAAVAVAFALACALWWLYFAFAADAIRHALRAASVPIKVILPVLPYGHLLLVGGIIAISATLGEVIARPLDRLPVAGAALLYGGTALYLVTFGITRWRLARQVPVPRLAAAVICLALLPAAGLPPAIASLTMLAVVLIALNIIEARLGPRSMRPARPGARARTDAHPER